MKKRHLLKTMLLLFALIVGSSSVWAETVTLTNANIVNAGAGDQGYKAWSLTDDNGNSWSAYAIKNQHSKATSSYHYLQIKKYANSTAYYVQVPTLGTKITSIKMTVSSTQQPMTGGGNNATLYFSDSNSTSATGTGVASGTGTSSVTIDCSSLNLNTGYITASGAVRIWDVEVTYSTEGQSTLEANDLALENAPVALSFDLYNNSAAQTISYTTSSTGAVTVSANDYVTTTVDATNKTITVTPIAVTPSEQTITVSQAADDTYAAGQVTFTVNITNSDPNANDGSAEKPYTVAEARAAIDANSGVAGVYATGIVSEIVTAYNSQYGNISYNISADGTTDSDQLQAYRGKSYNGDDFTSANDIQVGDIVVVYGDLTKYGNTYEFAQGNQLVSLERPAASPVITSVDNVKLAANATSGEISYKVEHPVEGTTLTAVVSENWISDIQVTDEKVTFATSVNTNTTARSAVMTLKYEGAEDKAVTITQAAPVNDYAELPFEFDGGSSAIESTSGLSAEGLGSDYNNSPKLKFDGTGDYLLLQFNETPGTLTFNIKGNGFSGGTFTVQTSVDGVTFTDLESYTELGATQSEKFDNLAADVRYIKWIYTEKIDGNVALGNIKLAKPDNTPSISVASTSVAVEQEGGNGVIEVTYKNIDTTAGVEIVWYESDGVTALSEKPEWISSAEINTNTQNIDYQIAENTGDERKAYLKVYALDANANDVYSDLITITQAAYEAPFEPVTYTLASSITSGKHYIIVGVKDRTQAMGAQNGNNRAAVDVTILDGVATVESAAVFEFVIYGPDADGYYTIFDAKNGDNGGYLYAASSGSNHLKTEEEINDNARWKITFIERVASIIAEKSGNRNVMQYNPSNTLFSCYASASQNSVYLYEKDDEAAPTESVTVSSVSYATYSSENALNFSKTGIRVYTANANGTSVKLTEVRDGIVPAYTGVVLYANGGASATVPVATSTSGTTWTDNQMVANVKRAIVKLAGADDKTNYILSNETDGVGFYKAAANGAYLPANRAYLSTTATATGNAPFLGFDGNETTGINSVERGALSVEGCYTLDGRRVAQPTKGLYIVNGRKVIIK